jgi:hypothetical protein
VSKPAQVDENQKSVAGPLEASGVLRIEVFPATKLDLGPE